MVSRALSTGRSAAVHHRIGIYPAVASSSRPSGWKGASSFLLGKDHFFCGNWQPIRKGIHQNGARLNSDSKGKGGWGARSPHAVLQVSANASKNEIKAAFRKLAKQHHPDLKIHHDQDEDGDGDDVMMAELIDAYEKLMSKHNQHFWTDARSSRVALACEIHTIDELRSMSYAFDIYSFRITFDCNDRENETTTYSKTEERATVEDRSAYDSIKRGNQQYHLDSTPTIRAHPDDSVSDLKRHIQSYFVESWGLDGQRVDRDGLYLGWELVHCENQRGGFASSDGEANEGEDTRVLSYHLFLHSYDIQEGDVLHAVVRRKDNMP